MQNPVKIICVALFSIMGAFSQNSNKNDVIVTISNLKSNNGKVFIALYDSELSFLDKGIQATFSKIENNSCKVTFKNVPSGIYAVSMFHDENDNNKMDSNFLGIPKEDYGCSNNAKGFMGPPKWEDAKFEVSNQTVNQYIKL